MENFLLPGETLLRQAPNNVVVLTTHRIRYNHAASAEARLVSIMLEKVSACEVRYHSAPALLLLGVVIAVLGGLALVQPGSSLQAAGLLGVLLGGLLAVAYFTTRRHIISIAADGGTRIGFETKDLKREAVIAFIDAVEKAKHERLLSLSHYAYAAIA